MVACRHAARLSPISWSIFDLPEKEAEFAKLKAESEKEDLWADPKSAQRLMKKLSVLQDEVEGWKKLSKRIADTHDLAEMGDESMQLELEQETSTIEEELKRLEMEVLLSGPYDRGNAMLEINSGAGGTDSQDWA
ncbi:MAG: PCRF domain-containing protein, partial [Anaerolineaceae bacterium]